MVFRTRENEAYIALIDCFNRADNEKKEIVNDISNTLKAVAAS